MIYGRAGEASLRHVTMGLRRRDAGPPERTIADSSYVVPSTWHFEASFHAGDDADGGQGEEAQLEKTRASVAAKVAQSEVELC